MPSMGVPARNRIDQAAPSVWQAPLVPVALAFTAGILLDRYAELPFAISLTGAATSLFLWCILRQGRQASLSFLYLGIACAGLGASYHHVRQDFSTNDIHHFAGAEQRPVQVRGFLDQEPHVVYQSRDRPPTRPGESHDSWQDPQVRPQSNDPLLSMEHEDVTSTVLRATALKQGDSWIPVCGKALVHVTGHADGVHVGDEVEVTGRLIAPRGPANPGEDDHAALLRDRGIGAEIVVRRTAAGVTRLDRSWPRSPTGWLMVIRGWGQDQLRDLLPAEQGTVATALLLGEGSTMTHEDWQRYIRTGVVHALAVSGLHLVILSGFLWRLLRVFGLNRRQAASLVALVILAYAVLTGGRPPAVRAAVMVLAFCGGLLLRRTVLASNSLALAWLVVLLINPAALVEPGCQLSFLSVAVLYWGVGPWLRPDPDPLEQLVEQTRPPWQKLFLVPGRWVLNSYILSFGLWMALLPLISAHYHLVTLAGLVLGPPVLGLTAVALVSGFLMLALAAVWQPLAFPFAALTRACLFLSSRLVYQGDRFPGGHWYVGNIPTWWLWGFYGGLLLVLSSAWLRARWRTAVVTGVLWTALGLAGAFVRLPADELRCTFLAVGHGGCTVFETADGRTLLYDAGAITGPDVTRRQIAPFLWHRGIRRIDEIFLSHADLDHFNGLPALLDRFAVGQVSCTPTFADKATPGVRFTLELLEKQRIPVRVLRAGDRLQAVDVDFEVLHPPSVGPDGNENTRSLVLLVHHAGHSLLLTGDLEGAGLERVLGQSAPKVDVLMAPHHGSRVSNTPRLAAWAHPGAVVSCEGPPRGGLRHSEPYTALGARFLGTWPHGAVTIHSHSTGLVLETYQTGERLVLHRGSSGNLPSE
jgi:competence protein ComEC